MYSFFHKVFSDWEGGLVFNCFSVWHWMYILLILALIVWSVLRLKGKSAAEQKKGIDVFINIVTGLYVADLFLMPFALGEIDVDKLPFHACTSMCVMCFCSNHNRFLAKFRIHFALLGAISAMMYMVYPSGVMSYETHPLSYRAVQTLLFHSLLLVYGVLAIVFDERGLRIRECYKDALILVVLTGWAFLGNTMYSGAAGDYSRDFNWFFIRQDPFGLLPEAVAPYLAPVVNFLALFLVELAVYFIYAQVKKYLCARKAENKTKLKSA